MVTSRKRFYGNQQHCSAKHLSHYSNVIMNTMVSLITSVSSVCPTVWAGTHQRKHQSSASVAFVRGIHWWPVDSPHKGPVTQKMFSCDDTIMWRDGWNGCVWISLRERNAWTPCVIIRSHTGEGFGGRSDHINQTYISDWNVVIYAARSRCCCDILTRWQWRNNE